MFARKFPLAPWSCERRDKQSELLAARSPQLAVVLTSFRRLHESPLVIGACSRHWLGARACRPLATTVAQTPVPPPIATLVAKVDTIHGDIMVDNYFWLRDRKNPDVIKHLEAENAYTDQMTKHLQPVQEQLYKEMLGRIKQTDLSVPVRRDSFYYYTRTEEGKQYQIYARKKGSPRSARGGAPRRERDGRRQGLLPLGARGSPDHRLFAFLVDTAGSEHFTLVVKNIARNTMLPDRIDDVHFGIQWANDNRTLFYTRTDSAQRPDRIFRHTLGMPTSSDAMVHHQPDALRARHLQDEGRSLPAHRRRELHAIHLVLHRRHRPARRRR